MDVIDKRGAYWQQGSLFPSLGSDHACDQGFQILIWYMYKWIVHKCLFSLSLYRSNVSTMFWGMYAGSLYWQARSLLPTGVLIDKRGPYWQAGSLLTSGVLIPKLYWWRVHKSLLSVRLHRSLVSTMFWMCGVLIDIIGDIIDKQGHHWQAGSFLTSRILIANRVPFWRAGSILTSGIFISKLGSDHACYQVFKYWFDICMYYV